MCNMSIKRDKDSRKIDNRFENSIFTGNQDDTTPMLHTAWAFIIIASVMLGLLIGAGISAIAI